MRSAGGQQTCVVQHRRHLGAMLVCACAVISTKIPRWLAQVRSIISMFFSPTLAKMLATLAVAMILVFRPQGLFGAAAR